MAASRRLILVACSLLLLAGCGQKGPLYLEGRKPHAGPKATLKTKPAGQPTAPAVQEPQAPADKDDDQP